MADLFFYGTLCHRPVLDLVLGEAAMGAGFTAAELPDHAVYWVAGKNYPMITAQAGAKAPGLLVSNLGEEAVARLDFYEGGHLYALKEVTVETATGPRPAQVYFPDTALPQGAPWRLADWGTRWGALSLLAARDIMDQFGLQPAEAVARRFDPILTRAAARLNAQTSAPTTLRRKASPGDVQVLEQRAPYAHFFAVEEHDLTHIRFDGRQSPTLNRATFVSADAVTVLPYDPVRDRVLLIEQFRMGPFVRGDAQCWSLEAIAGRLDAGETPPETARREAQEEAGLALGALHKVANYYSSPGAKTEYLYSFVALADLPDGTAGFGGLPGEGEDIRSHIVSYDHLMALLESGELENAPLVLSVLWLSRNRDRLRAGA